MPSYDVKSSTSDELISGSDASVCDESTDTSYVHTEDGEYLASPSIYTIADSECVVDPTIHTIGGRSHHIGLKDEPEELPCTAKGGLGEPV